MIKIMLSIWFLLILLYSYSLAASCNSYVIDVRKNSALYLGLSYPYYYNIGQIVQESNCRPDITAFDGGQGLTQFMPDLTKAISSELGMPLNMHKPKDAIRAQAYYLSKIINKHFKQESISFGKQKIKIHPKKYIDKCGLKLWESFQSYNGGYWWLYEAHKANYSCNRDVVKSFCTRGGAWVGTKKDRWLSFCDVNYSYPDKIFMYGNKYKLFESPDWRFW